MESTSSKSTPLYVILLLGIPTCVLPLLLVTATLDPALMPRFLALAVVLFVLVPLVFNRMNSATRGTTAVVPRSIVVALSLYAVCMILSLTQATNLSEGILETVKTLLFLAFLLAATFLLHSRPESLSIVVDGISILMLVVSVIGIGQFYHFGFEWVPGAQDAQPYSTFTNKNLFSSFLFLATTFVLYGFLCFHGRRHILYGASLLLSFDSIIVAQTRAVWVAMILSSAFVILLVLFLRARNGFHLGPARAHLLEARTRQLGLLLSAALVINLSQPILFPIPTTGQISTVEKAESIFDAKNESRNERLSLWHSSLLMIKDHPLLGVGAGNWKINLPHYGVMGTRMEWGGTHFPQPHNDFLWVASETGLVGAGAYVALFVLALSLCWKTLRRSENINDQILSLVMGSGIIGYLVISFFDFPKERIEHLVYVALILATVFSTYDRMTPAQRKLPRAAVVSLVAVLMVVLAGAIVIGAIRVKSEVHVRKALAAKATRDWNGVIEEIDKGYSAMATLDPMVTPLPWYRGVAYFSKNDTAKALQDFRKAYEIHPYHIHVLNNLGSCYEMAGDHAKAIDMYQQALRISPRFEEALLNLTAAYFNAGRYEEAYQSIMRCRGSTDPRANMFLNAVQSKLRRE